MSMPELSAAMSHSGMERSGDRSGMDSPGDGSAMESTGDGSGMESSGGTVSKHVGQERKCQRFPGRPSLLPNMPLGLSYPCRADIFKVFAGP